MNIKPYFLMSILFPTLTLPFFLQNRVAENYTQIRLPEGAKARLGKGGISDIAYSPDGTRLAVGGSLGVWIYDVRSGDETDLLFGPWDISVRSVSFSPDGKTLASIRKDSIIELWDVNIGTLKNTIPYHSDIAHSISFSPDGQTLATGNWYGSINLW